MRVTGTAVGRSRCPDAGGVRCRTVRTRGGRGRCRWFQIIADYTRPGDLVFDPLAGIGTTLVEAVRARRNAFGIEYEPGWVALARANIALTRRQGGTGHARLAQGDATRLLWGSKTQLRRLSWHFVLIAGACLINLNTLTRSTAAGRHPLPHQPNAVGIRYSSGLRHTATATRSGNVGLLTQSFGSGAHRRAWPSPSMSKQQDRTPRLPLGNSANQRQRTNAQHGRS
jgi:hypothetical protein